MKQKIRIEENEVLHDSDSLCLGFFYYIKAVIKAIFLSEITAAQGFPVFRGKIHLLLVYFSPVWIGALYRSCYTPRAYIAASITVGSCLFNFTASALLHNGTWSRRMSVVMTKLDYAGIFIMISGSCSPVPVMLMSNKSCTAFLIIQWSAACLGVLMTIFGKYTSERKEVRALIYVTMGLSNCIFINQMFQLLTAFELKCILMMGGFYVLGAVCYARHAPNIWPAVIGYHEMFHACCLISAICTFVLNKSILSRVALISTSNE